MATYISHSPAETEALGEAWGRAAQSGLVIGLSGDLGAGKTQLVKGLARGLGIAARVHSPTFTLINIYAGGRLTLFHLDLYRLETREQIEAAGLEDYLRPVGVTVIEWAERLEIQNPKSKIRNPNGGSKVEGRGNATSGSRFTFHVSRIAHHASPLRSVHIEVLSETERRITYEDSGA
jgi:tRNA threonylcarbamoyladenosine biosynthesis protein TsaE